jgi:Ca2+-binding EF-hand superfamily protein
MMKPRMVDAFQKVDADGDAVITAAELDDLVAGAIDRMDRNGDGVISADDRGRRERE